MNRPKNAKRQWSKLGGANLLAMLVGLTPLAARAQADAPATPPAMPPPAAPPPATPPPTSADAMPATRSDKLPPIDVGAWLRIGAKFQKKNPKYVNDFAGFDSIYGELHAGGKIHKNVSVTLNLNADGLAKGAGIEDAILGFDIADPFHVWVGQLLVPNDRANWAGPFFMIPWNYPGAFTSGAIPKEGPSGRNAGAVVWGDVEGGTFTYILGAFKAGDSTANPLLSGRLNLDLIGKEGGFWGNATYFGDKDVLALGAFGQYQKAGSVGTAPPKGVAPATDFGEVGADLLGEAKLGGGGWVTGEVDYYHFKGDYSPVKDEVSILAAIASPVMGIGNIQPMIRYQLAKTDAVNQTAVDVGLSYLIKGPALRLVATYEHTDLGNNVIGNSVQVSSQAIFF